LIQEIWLRNLSKAKWTIRDQGHFYAIASLAMRRVLTDMARRRLAERRKGEEPMPEDAGALNNTPDKDARKILEIGMSMDRLETELPDCARVIDMHYFAGFSFGEIAETNGLSVRQVRLRWEKGIKWLKNHHQRVASAG
jgi:RNA polymerase sigma factor (TIGR02999 family)